MEDSSSEALPAAVLTHELRLVGAAVDLVAAGGAPRVTLVGLRAGEELLELARAMGNGSPVTFRATPHVVGGRGRRGAFDLVIEHG